MYIYAYSTFSSTEYQVQVHIWRCWLYYNIYYCTVLYLLHVSDLKINFFLQFLHFFKNNMF